MTTTIVPLIVRGKIIEQDLVTFEGRRGVMTFSTPDVNKYLGSIVLSNPLDMRDLYAISLDDIITFLVSKGARLDVKDSEERTALTWAEGVFLATHPSRPKPSSIALIKELMSKPATAQQRTSWPGHNGPQ